ncbi:hypothetical protein BDF20DRAFT_698251 [Mycotypha africana]|uniref:uncharacterized protein n=1 Tax=Mycotypha africana TaxID=64632 RepID=UPI00230082A8|nr:uncharacterized protein BDF20DRAFT_698251 [Mycotypha africana]KAI8971776.1 hypothetical protein BDF20DRAFT_698251 [Mycotypha africana]
MYGVLDDVSFKNNKKSVQAAPTREHKPLKGNSAVDDRKVRLTTADISMSTTIDEPTAMLKITVPKLAPSMQSTGLSSEKIRTGKPMIRARSHSDQRPGSSQQQQNQQELGCTPVIPALYQSESDQPVSLMSKNFSSKTGFIHASSSSPLARRVRSATTLRQTTTAENNRSGEKGQIISLDSPLKMTPITRSTSTTPIERDIPECIHPTEAELCKQKLELQQQQGTDCEPELIPIIAPLDLDSISTQQQFYDAIWGALGDLNGWLEAMEISLYNLDI